MRVHPVLPTRVRRTALLGALVVLPLAAAACSDDDDSPDDTDVDVVTSDVSGSSVVPVDSEVTIGTTLTSEVLVTEVETDVSEVEATSD